MVIYWVCKFFESPPLEFLILQEGVRPTEATSSTGTTSVVGRHPLVSTINPEQCTWHMFANVKERSPARDTIWKKTHRTRLDYTLLCGLPCFARVSCRPYPGRSKWSILGALGEAGNITRAQRGQLLLKHCCSARRKAAA